MGAEAYAVINDEGVIINTVVWDGVSQWAPPEGTIAVRCGEQLCGIGGTYKDGKFYPPPEPEIPQEELVAKALQLKSSLISEASQQISILQDAVDLDMATDEEKATLLVWKKYRVLLNRVDPNLAPDIDWPAHP